jgi:hypothetical protein
MEKYGNKTGRRYFIYYEGEEDREENGGNLPAYSNLRIKSSSGSPLTVTSLSSKE